MQTLTHLTPVTVPKNKYPYAKVLKRVYRDSVEMNWYQKLEDIEVDPNKLVELTVKTSSKKSFWELVDKATKELEDALAVVKEKEGVKDLNPCIEHLKQAKQVYTVFEELAGQALSILFADVEQYKPRPDGPTDKLPDSIAERMKVTALNLFKDFLRSESYDYFSYTQDHPSKKRHAVVVSLQPFEQGDSQPKVLVEIIDNPGYKNPLHNKEFDEEQDYADLLGAPTATEAKEVDIEMFLEWVEKRLDHPELEAEAVMYKYSSLFADMKGVNDFVTELWVDKFYTFDLADYKKLAEERPVREYLARYLG